MLRVMWITGIFGSLFQLLFGSLRQAEPSHKTNAEIAEKNNQMGTLGI